MKRIISILYILCITIPCYTQIKSSFETILIHTDKKNYLYTDTIYISGLVVAADVMMPSELSKYAMIDITDENGDIVTLKKVRLENSFLNCRIPIFETSKSSFYIIRAYTEFMRNFPESTWPRTAVGIREKLTPEIVQDKSLYNIKAIEPYAKLSYSTDKKEYFPNDTIRLRIDNTGRDVHLTLRLEKENEKRKSILQGAVRRLQQLDNDTFMRIMQGQYDLNHFPEQTLSIEGTVKTENRRKFKKGGRIVAFSHQTGAIYEHTVNTEGHFSFAIEDFKDGETFFLQAYDKKGESHFYDIDIRESNYPTANLPTIEWESTQEKRLYNPQKVDTTHTHWIPEITVKARLKKDFTYSPEFYKNNYLKKEDIAKRNYIDLEQIIEAMPGITIGRTIATDEEYNNSETIGVNLDSPRMILSQRGAGVIGKLPIVGVRIDNVWAAEEVDFDKIKNEINIRDIATIEYIPAIRAHGLYGPRAFYGVLLITTSNGNNQENIQSKGIRYQPLGLSDNRPFSTNIPLHNKRILSKTFCDIEFIAPNYAGNYRIVIEGLGSRKMIYKEIDIKVIP